MRALLLAACLLAPLPARASAPAKASSGHSEELEALIRDDYNAVRRARYALRKTQDGTPEHDAAEKQVKDAKRKLKDDRLKLRAMRKKTG